MSEELAQRDLTVVRPVVGEQVTSLDMAGVSLSVMYLDEDLERWWLAPADSPAYTLGTVERGNPRRVTVEETRARIPAGAPDSARQARVALRILQAMTAAAAENERSLGRLDWIAGDGDHGQAMVLGTSAAVSAAQEAVEAGAGLSTLLRRSAAAWSEGAGGTSGAVWAAALDAVAGQVGDGGPATGAQILDALIAGADAFETIGGAVVGDKTIVDASRPFADELHGQASAALTLVGAAAAWTEAARVATAAAEATSGLVARKGRARTHGQASVGHADPGAVSFALLMTAAAEALQS